ncbi:MAG: hypothetical protein JXM69_15435 [Anaerolineae bacterium]|nr:hypothetical protein [Anaerolineae bacterium]
MSQKSISSQHANPTDSALSPLSSLLSLLPLLLILLILSPTAHAQEPAPSTPEQSGVLAGQVINHTTDQPQGNLEVTLRGFQDDAEIVNLATFTDNEGCYTFEKLPTEHTIFYILEGTYQNVAYVSDEPIVFTPGSTETTFDLKVYETTTSDEAINISQLHYILAFAPGTVNVAQIFVLNNQGNRTYIGSDGQTFTFALPQNAININFQEEFPGARFIQMGSNYADTAPITPNAENFPVAVTYDLPFDTDTLTIDVPIPGRVDSLNVLLTEQGAQLSSDQVQFMDTRQMQGSTFAIYGGAGLVKGDTLSLQLNNLDNLEFTNIPGVPASATLAPAQTANQDLLRWLIIGLGGLAIVVAIVVYPLLNPQLAQPDRPDYNDPQTRQQKLLFLLARLDEAFEAGDLAEQVYRQARARYKAELASLMEE